MNIQIKMHSELDCPLRPNMDLILEAVEEMKEMPERYNKDGVAMILSKVQEIDEVEKREIELNQKIKEATGDEKEALKIEKQHIVDKYNLLLDNALDLIQNFGGDEVYGYKYDLHFNRVVAGLMGSTCYMKDTFEDLQKKRVKEIKVIAKTVENNGHHSTFGHSHLTLEMTGIPKMLAMVLNNEKEYNTSEKSARYTIMDNLSGKESELFYKWKEIFAKEINMRYGHKRPFFDERGVKVDKLAQENARYMLSVFTPTNMVYTTSFRQLNYLAHWFEDMIAFPNANPIYKQLIPDMQEFVDWVKDNGLYSENLEDGKDRKLSLFGAPLFKQLVTSDVYALCSEQSFACLAQAQRHRTINYHIDEESFFSRDKKFYVPKILTGERLQQEFLSDISSVGDAFPQGTLLPVVERGTTEDFLLKARERVCVLAQKEIRDLTQSQCRQFARELADEENAVGALAFRGDIPIRVVARKKNEIANLQKNFQKMSLTARCSAGYECTSPCKFGEGIGLQSLV